MRINSRDELQSFRWKNESADFCWICSLFSHLQIYRCCWYFITATDDVVVECCAHQLNTLNMNMNEKHIFSHSPRSTSMWCIEATTNKFSKYLTLYHRLTRRSLTRSNVGKYVWMFKLISINSFLEKMKLHDCITKFSSFFIASH